MRISESLSTGVNESLIALALLRLGRALPPLRAR
jgi:hypothetical protein